MTNREILLDVIGELDESLIPDLDAKPRRPILRQFGAIAAAVAVFALLVTAAMRFGTPRQIPTVPPVTTEPVTEATEVKEAATEPPTQRETVQPTGAAPTEATAAPELPTDPPETAAVTEAPESSAGTETPVQTEAPTPPVTEPPETVPETALEVTESQGFRIETFRDRRCIVTMDAFPEASGTLRPCELQSDMVELAEVREGDGVNEYRIRPVGGETEFTATQQEYESFTLTVDLDAEISVAIDERKCFLVVQDETCALYWFIDGEGFTISGRDEDLKYLLEISRKLRPIEE